MPPNEITELFSDVIRKWRTADSQRTIFGVDMLQTQNALNELCESLQKIFGVFQSFSIVKKDQAMEIVVKTDESAGGASAITNIPANLPTMPKIFEQLKVNSLSLGNGLNAAELKALFTGISMKVEEIDQQGGLKGFLKTHGVTHIAVDQMKFKLLEDVDEEGSDTPTGGGSSKTKKKKASGLTKLRDSAWKDYLDGTLNNKDFKDQHKDLIEAASENPKQIEKILKHLITKQKKSEEFLALLEQKLTDVGFSTETFDALKKKLIKPKKVMVDEGELARLRKIEKEFQKSADTRIDDSLKTIKAIEKKLSDETARSEAMMHQMGEGGMILDKKGKIVSVNTTAQKVLGLSEAKVLGKTVKEIIQPHHIMTAVSDWQSETEGHTPKEIKVKALSDETLAIIRESAIVIENESGRSIGVLSALQNITQQEELNRRKNDILDVLGHDLRAPLSSIKMNFDILAETTKLDTEGTDQQKKFLSNCQSSIQRMNNLIEKILDMRQLETGKIMLKYDTVETNSLLEQAVNAQSEWAKNKSIILKVNAASLPDIEGDPERLYQIITNLVSNALKFTPEGGSITAEGKTVKKEGTDYVEIAVKDSGMGIDKDNIKKIFDKYEQVTINAPKGVRGLGLGLSICKTIIELHGGTIWADSELEKGSTFTFQVPIKQKKENV